MSLTSFVVRVTLASENEPINILPSSLFWKSLIMTGGRAQFSPCLLGLLHDVICVWAFLGGRLLMTELIIFLFIVHLDRCVSSELSCGWLCIPGSLSLLVHLVSWCMFASRRPFGPGHFRIICRNISFLSYTFRSLSSLCLLLYLTADLLVLVFLNLCMACVPSYAFICSRGVLTLTRGL